MKAIPFIPLLIACLMPVFAQEADERVVLIPWTKMPPPAPKEVPLFFSAEARVEARVELKKITSEQTITFRVHQGKPATLTLALNGPGLVTGVTGDGLMDWSVRVGTGGERFLDLRPNLVNDKLPENFSVRVSTLLDPLGSDPGLLLPGPAASTGISLAVNLAHDPAVEVRITRADGLVAVDGAESSRFVGSGSMNPVLSLQPVDKQVDGLDLRDAVLNGSVAPSGDAVTFRLSGTAHARWAGAKLDLLGGAALASGVSGDGWHVALKRREQAWMYELVAEREGAFPIDLSFDVPVKRRGDWRDVAFSLSGGVVVPVVIDGLAGDVEFDRERSVVPAFGGGRWRGFLPSDGGASLAWRIVDKVADGSLFYSSTEVTDVRVGSGLLRQRSSVDLRVLQGKLGSLTLALDGPGEVLSVSGDAVLAWSVTGAADKRVLEVKLSRPVESSARLVIDSQAALGGFPVEAKALRLVPAGSVRHSGWLRVANDGAVRVEVGGASGLIQLAPGQFPGGEDASLRQVFVYRFPSAQYGFKVLANQVLPEVGLTEVTVYELAESDRRIVSDLELDIREAPLREWEVGIPADHAVAGVSGAEVADYVVGAEAKDGIRMLKVLFRQPVSGRQLVSVSLEKNEAAKAGAWRLQPLVFPGVKSRRGYVGALSAAGYRLQVGESEGVAEVPVSFFPKQTGGLQQAFRLREEKWSLGLVVEALGQSISADVFHLYALKTDVVYGSVVLNYFVIGAPAGEWRIEVPAEIGNVDVTGLNVGRDWRRDGNTVIVPLSRPVLGAGTVLLTFEQPVKPGGGSLPLGGVKPVGVDSERGYVQVVSPLQVNHRATTTEGLLAIDPSELPAEFRLLSSAPTLAAWQYTARDFSIDLEVDWFEAGETVAQVVDFQKLTSHVARDGQWATDARIFVRSRGAGALRMRLPEGAILWEAKVDGETVNARKDDDATLVPLPMHSDPNQVVEVAFRYGARSKRGTHPVLAAPRLDVPMVIGEWKIRGDEGRQLVPRGGTADLVRPVLAADGWEWISNRTREAVVLLALGLVAVAAATGNAGWFGRMISMICGLAFIVVCGWLAVESARTTRGMMPVLEYAAPVVAAGREVSVELGNVPTWASRIGWFPIVLGFAGVVLAMNGVWTGRRLRIATGVALVAAMILSVRGGMPFFLGLAGFVGLAWWLPGCIAMVRGWRRPKVAVAAAVAVLAGWITPDAGAEEKVLFVKPAEELTHDWVLQEGRLSGTIGITVRAEKDDRFLLLHAPAVLSSFEGAGLRVTKEGPGGEAGYWLVADEPGRFSGRATFEMPLPEPMKGWAWPGGAAAVRKVSMARDETGWEFACDGAARIDAIAGPGNNRSGASMVLGLDERTTFVVRPKQRDVGAEATRFYSDVSNLFIPGPGVVGGRHLVQIRPSQGRVASIVAKVPAGFTVSDVVDGPVGQWRFDPDKRELRINVEPAQAGVFSFLVETQRGESTLPVDLSLEPLRVTGGAGEVGFLGLAFGDEVQPEKVESEGLSRVNTDDFPRQIVPQNAKAEPLVLLQHAFRYGAEAARARLRVTAVSPELRSECWQLVSLGEDRLVLAADIGVTITRAGLFQIAVEVPEGLEIESATGQGLSHWAEVRENGKRLINLHLSGKTIGRRDFSLTLSGKPVGNQASWQVPRVSLVNASRETGVVAVVPERGLRVLAVARHNVSQLDPRELADNPSQTSRAAARPGALAYRLLQGDWSLALRTSSLNPWVTARVYQDATLREGQFLSRVHIAYRIENAAVKSQRVRIPGLDEKAAGTVRATGPAVADFVKVDGEKDVWEVRFQRGIAGETSVDVEYQRLGKDESAETIEPVELIGSSQQTYFAAVRSGGRLQVAAGELPRGWQRTDWAVVQSSIGAAAEGSAPAMAFRVSNPEGPLPVTLRRHQLADLRKLRVSEGTLTTLLAPGGAALTAVSMKMQAVDKTRLRLKLPPSAELFHVFVNNEGALLVRESGDWLFHVSPSPEVGAPAEVRFVYSTPAGSDVLVGPVLDVPMENLTWRVLVPEGWRLAGHGGDFDLKETGFLGSFQLEDYQRFVSSKRKSDARSAVALLDQANAWLEAGDQEKAGLALGNAVNNGLLDEASGEDARVQLRALKTQQAVLGLNTRRQRLVLDNRYAAPEVANPQIDRAARANPVFRGSYNFDPKQFDRFLEGNSSDEVAALKEIANRIVSQQLAAEPAPAALDVTLPERGTVLRFGRSVQVDGGRPMELRIKLERAGTGHAWAAAGICLLLGAFAVSRRK